MFTSYFKCKNCNEFFKVKTSGRNIDYIVCTVCGSNNLGYANKEEIKKLDKDED